MGCTFPLIGGGVPLVYRLRIPSYWRKSTTSLWAAHFLLLEEEYHWFIGCTFPLIGGGVPLVYRLHIPSYWNDAGMKVLSTYK